MENIETIQAKDLSIGNLVMFEGLIETVNGNFIANVENKSLVLDPEPIKLTKEWYPKLGLTRLEGIYFYRHKFATLTFEVTGTGKLFMTHGDFVRYFKYVHEFQNYIHAVTGENLIYKL